MSNEFYSLMINQFLVTPHPDQSVSIVMSGIAVDTETPEGGDFELKVNGQRCTHARTPRPPQSGCPPRQTGIRKLPTPALPCVRICQT